jgi:hypothetical protein
VELPAATSETVETDWLRLHATLALALGPEGAGCAFEAQLFLRVADGQWRALPVGCALTASDAQVRGATFSQMMSHWPTGPCLRAVLRLCCCLLSPSHSISSSSVGVLSLSISI